MVCKVVSIEDEPEIAELLRIVLASPEIEIYSCDNGPDGIQLVRTCKPDLVILDIMLPGMNGWAVYDTIRADDELKKTPIVMLSVLREEPGRRQAFVGSPVDLYVTKPFDTLRLREGIERMLGRKGLWPTTKSLIRGTGELKALEVPPEKPESAVSGNGSYEAKPAPEQLESPPVQVVSPEPVAALPASATAAVESGEKQETVIIEATDKQVPQVVAIEQDPLPQTPSETPLVDTSEPVSAAEEPASNPGPDSNPTTS
jgi:CheY-like chemotaxis protein